MGETWNLALSLAAGILLGTFFFGGLWWTVHRGVSSRNPGLWFIGSTLLRTSAVMTGFYFLLGLPAENWQILLAGLLGFIITRLVATRLAGTDKSDLDHLERKASHAP